MKWMDKDGHDRDQYDKKVVGHKLLTLVIRNLVLLLRGFAAGCSSAPLSEDSDAVECEPSWTHESRAELNCWTALHGPTVFVRRCPGTWYSEDSECCREGVSLASDSRSICCCAA